MVVRFTIGKMSMIPRLDLGGSQARYPQAVTRHCLARLDLEGGLFMNFFSGGANTFFDTKVACVEFPNTKHLFDFLI